MKIIFFNYLIIIFYLISSSVSYSIERPEIKNLIVHKDKKKIKNIEFIKSEGQKVSLNNYKSNPLIINFWATWCAPCKREMPSLEKLTFEYPEIKVFAINTEKPNKIRTRDFFRSVGVTTLNTYYDPDLSLVKTFKLRGLPTSILIDKNGEEFGRVIGEVDFASEDFLNLMKKYI